MLHVKTSSGKWEKFCNQIIDFLKADLITLNIDGTGVRGFRSPDSPALWIRDHSDMLRAGRYIEQDVTSAVEAFANSQAANGRIFDTVMMQPLQTSTDRENWEKWVRVPVEADVEYRFVKAAYLAWQSTGDNEWLEKVLPGLERALAYSLSHPLRWDSEHQLIKRPYTIDTWDFDYTAGRAEWLNFQITDNTYWGIFHGDNSGVYETALLMSWFYKALSNDEQSERWLEIARPIQTHANELLFNGRFYTHFYKLTPLQIEGVDESEQLSLSNPMAINRGLATHEIAQAILYEYQKRGKTTHAFAEWFGIDPPFPNGIFGDPKLVSGAYINGGIFPLVGGELAKAAFGHGFEKYGLQTLEKYHQMISASNASYLWYFPDGSPCTQETSTSPEAAPTDGWGSSAMLVAFVEGLCGIEDLAHSFKQVKCSPRWCITDENDMEIRLSYEASGAFFGYEWRHSRETKTVELKLLAKESDINCQVLLPSGSQAISLHCDGEDSSFETQKVDHSSYIRFNRKVCGSSDVTIKYH